MWMKGEERRGGRGFEVSNGAGKKLKKRQEIVTGKFIISKLQQITTTHSFHAFVHGSFFKIRKTHPCDHSLFYSHHPYLQLKEIPGIQRSRSSLIGQHPGFNRLGTPPKKKSKHIKQSRHQLNGEGEHHHEQSTRPFYTR